MTSELKPCPFCGATDPAKRYFSTKCRTCGGACDNDNWSHRPIEDALRAEVEALKKQLDIAHKTTVKYIEEDNAGYLAATAEVARLQAELAKFTGPLTDEQVDDLAGSADFWRDVDRDDIDRIDAAIRAAREGER